jgi:fumarate hydratase class II
MPGKVNPVMSEMLIQVCGQVIGNDAAITFGGALGNFELNVMMPLIAHNLLQSIELLTQGALVFARRCVVGIEADAEKCEADIERSLAMCTPLAKVIGYDKAAAIAKTAYETNRTVREVAREISGLSDAQLNELLDPARLTSAG